MSTAAFTASLVAVLGSCMCVTDVDMTRYRLIRIRGVQIRQREEIRERYGIRGSPWHDCLWSCWCRPCAQTQEYREILLEEANFESQA